MGRVAIPLGMIVDRIGVPADLAERWWLLSL